MPVFKLGWDCSNKHVTHTSFAASDCHQPAGSVNTLSPMQVSGGSVSGWHHGLAGGFTYVLFPRIFGIVG